MISKTVHLPIRVCLMDDDFFALKWNADLLTRDLRTTVCFEAESPTALLNNINNFTNAEIILLDVEYSTMEPTLPDLIHSIKYNSSQTAILCLSQYGGAEALNTAITSGAKGFLLKQDVRMGIGSALILALQVDFLVTVGVLPLLSSEAKRLPAKTVCLPRWVPHPGLTPQLLRVLIMRVMFGMSAPMVASKLHLAPSTVEKYMQYAYQRLNTIEDNPSFKCIDFETLSPEVRAFYRFTLLPSIQKK